MKLTVAFSEVKDGNMSFGIKGSSNGEVILNRTKFLNNNNIDISRATLVKIRYNRTNYCLYHESTDDNIGLGMFDNDIDTADALVVTKINHALFLPLADCIGMAVFDPTKGILMLSHIGRHSIEQEGGVKSIHFLIKRYGCNPSDLQIYLSPAPNGNSYPIFSINNRSFKDVIFEQLSKANILKENINNNTADTATDPRFFSHSEFLKGNRRADGRYAMVAMMRD